jgi:hypothetical protein
VIKAKVAGSISMRPVATATRRVLALPPTSTMWAWPWSSKWVSVVGVWLMAVSIQRVYKEFTRSGHHTRLELGKDSFETQIP